MLEGKSLIYFAPGTWDGLWRNRHQLMSVFARHNKVLFVERRYHLRPMLAAFRRGDLELSDLRRPSLRRISDNLYVFRYPAWAPISGRSPLKHLTRTVRRLSIQKALCGLQMSEPIVWFSQPDMIDLVREMPPARLLLYHVVDEYSAYSGHTLASRHLTEEREQEMMARVDAVVVVSKKLYEAKCPYNYHTYWVPNGVDYKAYTGALTEAYLPEDLRRIKKPRLGYSGLIGDRLDLAMLKGLAQENPHWSLVFLGEARVCQQATIWESLLALPNVHYLGLVAVSQVPHYLKGFQVGLLPYALGQESENISPLKLYDYLAAGLSVASVEIPAAGEFSSYIHLANGSRNFAEAICAALADTTPERRQSRRAVAAQHTWEARVEQLSDIIQERLTATAAG